jgi:hypothetical protein
MKVLTTSYALYILTACRVAVGKWYNYKCPHIMRVVLRELVAVHKDDHHN